MVKKAKQQQQQQQRELAESMKKNQARTRVVGPKMFQRIVDIMKKKKGVRNRERRELNLIDINILIYFFPRNHSPS